MWGARRGDKRGVLRKLSPLAILIVACLGAVPQASAAGLAQRQIAPAHETPRQGGGSHGPIAPLAVCEGQLEANASVAEQQRAMSCMTDYARRSAGLAGLSDVRQLERSSRGKSKDILRCDSFSHFACGRSFTYWLRASGYLSARCWKAGENLAWGVGSRGTVRAIFRAWMRSPDHRHNILGRFNQIGVSLRVGTLAGQAHTHVWTQHFGSHC
jgi:uncharacterized protein YkwD